MAEASARGGGTRAAVEAALTGLLATEFYHAHPGGRLLAALAERIAGGDAAGAARLIRRNSGALLSRSYRHRAGDWDVARSFIVRREAMAGRRRPPRGRRHS